MILIAITDQSLSRAIQRVSSRYEETLCMSSLLDIKLCRPEPRIIFLSEYLSDGSSIDILEELTGKSKVVVVGTKNTNNTSALRYVKAGATYLEPPILPEMIVEVITSTTNEVAKHPIYKEVKQEVNQEFVKGVSQSSIKMYNEIDIVAPHNITVVLHGETGTGKEHLASELHSKSGRKGKFVTIDCGAVSKELALSELFGHTKGSFTGATSEREGAFQSADGGTLFLDEVENLTLEVQMHLLRAIQEKKVRKIGTTKETLVDVRIVVATNVDLQSLVDEGKFRKDLFYRLSQFVIEVPTLSERKEDIPYLVEHFVYKYNKEFGKSTFYDKEFISKLCEREYPGNIRELQSLLRKAVLLSENKLTLSQDKTLLQQASSYKVSKIEIARALKISLEKLSELLAKS